MFGGSGQHMAGRVKQVEDFRSARTREPSLSFVFSAALIDFHFYGLGNIAKASN